MMKKLTSLFLAVISLLSVFFVGCGDKGSDSPGQTYHEITEAIANQAHEEKSGYKFCGYFKDKNFTKRVMEKYEEIPEGLYAKYQPDRTQLFSYSSNYARPKIHLTETIYAKNYRDAAQKYKQYLQHLEFLNMSNQFNSDAIVLGNGLTLMDVVSDNGEANKSFVFEDDSKEFVFNIYTEDGVERINISRNFTWDGYVGSVIGEVDGFEYYTVKNKYAVIVGVSEGEEAIDYNKYTFPSTIDGLPVKEISLNLSYDREIDIDLLTVPSSVENFFMLNTNTDCEIDKIVFEEGVKTIRLISGQTEDLVIPSTAYYVDLLRPNYGDNAPYEFQYAEDQEIVVNGGEHYYTANGFLISKEGDLIHQYSGRGNLNVEIPDGVKRVLRRSVNSGITKNFTIPKSVEFVDPLFDEYSKRAVTVCRGLKSHTPHSMLFVKSEKVANQLIESLVKEDLIASATIRNKLYFIMFDESIDLQKIAKTKGEKAGLSDAEINSIVEHYQNLPIKIEDNYVFAKVFDMEQGEYLDNSWEIVSCLKENYDLQLMNDYILRDYLEYQND